MFSKKEKRKKRKKKGPHRFTMTLKNRNDERASGGLLTVSEDEGDPKSWKELSR